MFHSEMQERNGRQGMVIKTSGGYGILGTFEVGESGVFEQRILVKDTSKKKAEKMLENYLNGK